MPNYKLIASDLDGTLLNSDQTISQENLKAIVELSKMGVEFFPCSGRTLAEMKDIYTRPEFRYVIYSNGSVIYDKKTNTKTTFYLDEPLIRRVFEVVAGLEVSILVHQNGEVYGEADKFTYEAMRYLNVSEYFTPTFLRDGTPIEEDLCEFVCKGGGVEMFCIHFRSPEDRLKCLEIYSNMEGVKIASSDPNNIEIFSKDASKGTSILKLAEMLGIKREETIAVGDSLNDITMIKSAGLGLVMSNGLAEVKEIADKVICSNKEHVAKYILENIIEN